MRVLVADDHSLFRDGIVSLLEAAGFEVVGQVGDGRAAVEESVRLRPDLVLMDINMPIKNGLEALRQIKAELPKTQVVMLTVSEEDQDLLEATKSGANGYLLKDLNARQFLQMLVGLEQGEAAMSGKSVRRLMESLATPIQPSPEPANSLSPREITLLQLVARGLSNRELAQRLAISENTVKYHLKQTFEKLGVQNRTEAVTVGIRVGLIRPEGGDWLE